MRYRFVFGAVGNNSHTEWIELGDEKTIVIGTNIKIELEQEYVKFEMAGVTGRQCQSIHVFVGGHVFRCSLREGHHGPLHAWDSSDMSETLSWKDSK